MNQKRIASLPTQHYIRHPQQTPSLSIRESHPVVVRASWPHKRTVGSFYHANIWVGSYQFLNIFILCTLLKCRFLLLSHTSLCISLHFPSIDWSSYNFNCEDLIGQFIGWMIFFFLFCVNFRSKDTQEQFDRFLGTISYYSELAVQIILTTPVWGPVTQIAPKKKKKNIIFFSLPLSVI